MRTDRYAVPRYPLLPHVVPMDLVPTADNRSRVLNGWCDCELSRRRPFNLTWRRERVAGWRDSTCCEGRGRAWVEGSPTLHSHQCFNGRALGSICGGANCLGAVNGRNADGLGVLKGLLYDVLRASVRDQSPGRYPGGAGGIVSGSSTLHDRHRSRLCTRCTANFFDIRFHTCFVHLALCWRARDATESSTQSHFSSSDGRTLVSLFIP